MTKLSSSAARALALAAGLPVVSVDLPPVHGISDRVTLVDAVAAEPDLVMDVATLTGAAVDLGLDPAPILAATETDAEDERLREKQRAAEELVGNDVGTPVVSFNGTAFFGPVLTRIPRGEEAGRIFDGAVALAEYPYFYEIKRARTTDPQFD